MKLTGMEKLIIGINIFLFLVLSILLVLQFAEKRLAINTSQPTVTPLTIASPPTNKPDLSIKVPEPTAKEEIGAKTPRGKQLGWVIVITSILLIIGGISIKLIRN